MSSPAPSFGVSMAESSIHSPEKTAVMAVKKHDTHIPKATALDVAIGRWALSGSSPHGRSERGSPGLPSRRRDCHLMAPPLYLY